MPNISKDLRAAMIKNLDMVIFTAGDISREVLKDNPNTIRREQMELVLQASQAIALGTIGILLSHLIEDSLIDTRRIM